MTSTTTNYNLTLYDATTDAGELFLDYRVDMCGTTGSNMTKLDAALTAIQVSIDALELSKGATFVNASFDSGSLFTATGISGITAYDTNLKIILQLDQDSDGTVTLNINSLGVKSVYYINNAGTATNLVGAHLKNNREYYLRYNGTVFVVVSDTENPSVWTMNTETLAATKTLTDYSESIQYLDPGGANRDIELPAEADSNPIFIIVNRADAAENLVVKDDSPATILTLNENETGMFIGNGVAWKGFLIEDATIYLQNVVEDTSPQLGGDLDVNGNTITNLDSSDTAKGIVELATIAEVNTGTDATRAVTPDALEGSIRNVIGRHTIYIPAKDIVPATTNGCSALTQIEMGTQEIEVVALPFAQGVNNYSQFSIAMPKGWDKTGLEAKFYWTANTTDTDTARWAINGRARTDGETLGVSLTATEEVLDGHNGSAWDLNISGETALANFGATADNEIQYIGIYRNGANAADDLLQTAYLLGVMLFYDIDVGNDD